MTNPLNDAKDFILEVLRHPIHLGKSTISLQVVGEAIFACVVVILVTTWFSAWLERRLFKRIEDLSLRKIASKAVRVALLAIGLVTTLSAIGVELTALSVFGGALGVGLGLGLQKLAANYVSGFVILAERSLRIGDIVKIDNFEGRVSDITTRYTQVRALNGREALIPNEKVITERVENWSLADSNVLLSSNVSVSYDSDVAQVRALLVDAARSLDRVLREPAPVALLANFGADGLEFTLSYWISDPENGQANVRSEVNLAILERLRAAEIEIPYPQRVVRHMGAPAPARTDACALPADPLEKA